MDRKAFVEAIRVAVGEAAIADVRSLLEKPPGRNPAESIMRLSAWFKTLPNEDRERLEKVVRLSVDAALFGFLCVLDGVRPIEDEAGKGTIELRYCKGESEIPLNHNDGEMLHELLRAAWS